MLKKHKYDIVLCLMVIVMTIFLSFILSINKIDKINEEDIDKLGRFSSARLTISGVNENNITIIEDIIKSQSNISLIGNYKSILNEDGKTIVISDVYYNYDDKSNLPPLVSGKFIPTKYDNSQNIVVVGKNVEKYCSNIEGEKFYEIDGINYKVVGVMGYKNRFSVFDDICFKNLNINIDIVNNGLLSLDFYSFSLQNTKLIDIKNKVDKLDQIENSSITYFSKDVNLSSTMSNTELYSIISIIIITFILISYFWLKSRFKIIAISKIYGAPNNTLIYSTILKFLCYVILGLILGIFIYYACTLTSFFYNKLNLSIGFFANTIISVVALSALVSSLIILFILIKTIINVSPLDALNNMYNTKHKKIVSLFIVVFIIIQLTLVLEYCSYTIYGIKTIRDNINYSDEILPYNEMYSLIIPNEELTNKLEINAKINLVNDLLNSKELCYLNQERTSISSEDILDNDDLYKNSAGNSNKRVFEFNGKKLVSYNALTVNSNFEKLQNLKLEIGREFCIEDFNSNLFSESIPVIVGYDFGKYLNIDDSISYYDAIFNRNIKLKVIGVLKKDEQYRDIATIASKESLNNFVILPNYYENIRYEDIQDERFKKIYESNYLSRYINIYNNAFSISKDSDFDKSKTEIENIFNKYGIDNIKISKLENKINDNSEYIKKQVNLYIFKLFIITIFSIVTIIISLRLYIQLNINRYAIEIIFGQKVTNIIRKIIIISILIVVTSCILQLIFLFFKFRYGNYINYEDAFVSFTITNLCMAIILIIFIFIFLKSKLNKKNILELSKRRE